MFVSTQSALYLMYYIAVFGTTFLCLIFYSLKPYPYSYTYPIILTLKIYQSVVLKVAQLFPVSSWFLSSLWLKSVSDFTHQLTGGKLPYFHWNLMLQIRFQNSLSSWTFSLLYNYSKTYQNCNRCYNVYNRTISTCIETNQIVIRNEWEGIYQSTTYN